MKRFAAILLAVFMLVFLAGCKPTAGEQPVSTPAAAQAAVPTDTWSSAATAPPQSASPTDQPAAQSAASPEAQPAAQPAAAPASSAAPSSTAGPAPTPVKFPARGYCNAEGVNLRAQPSTESDIIDVMGQNAAMDIMSLQDGWYKVNMGGITAYITEKLITLGEPPRPDNMRWAKVTVASSPLYVSPVPDSFSDMKLKQGDIVKTLRLIDGYLHVVYNNKLQRYIKQTDVTYISAEEALAAKEKPQSTGFPVPSPTP